MGVFVDITGKTFGRLVPVYYERNYLNKNGKKQSVWMCKCNCGNPDLIPVLASSLNSGNTQSCGCLHRELLAKRNKITKKKFNYYDLTGEYGIGYTFKKEPFYFDLEDFDKIKNYCWHIQNRGYVVCSINRGNNIPKKDILMHSLIMGIDTDNNPELLEVDHIGGRKSRNDNRKNNLRICKHQKNMCNYPLPSNNTSGVVGVSWDNTHSVWKAYITYKNQRVNLGSFSDFNEAVKTRKKAEEKYFGEYSNDNSQKITKVFRQFEEVK